MNTYLQLQFVLLKRLEDSDECPIHIETNPHTKMIIKQFTIIGIISTLQNVVESMLVLLYSLSLGYNDINKNMIYYNFEFLNNSIKKIRNKDVNFRKMLGYCDLSNMCLNETERKMLNDVYTKSIEKIHSMLLHIIEFYNDFRTAHEKFKHGLNFVPGLIVNYNANSEFKLEQSTMNFRSNKEIHKNLQFFQSANI